MKRTSCTTVHDFHPSLIAPCGINCGVCWRHLQPKNACPGCLKATPGKEPHPKCRIRPCAQEKGFTYCYNCPATPCSRLKALDDKYQKLFYTSLVENGRILRQEGIEAFLNSQRIRWDCPSCHHTLSIHSDICLFCGAHNPNFPPKEGQ